MEYGTMEIVENENDLDIESVLSRPLFAQLATRSDDGACHSPVWFLWEEQCIWIICNLGSDSFATRIHNNPLCSIGIIDFDLESKKIHHVGLRGSATIVDFDRERAIRKVSKYLGSKESWPKGRFALTDEKLRFIRFSPRTVVARDQSYMLFDRVKD